MSFAALLRGKASADLARQSRYTFANTIGVGTWAWGEGQVWGDQRTAYGACSDVYNEARAAGVRLFDTAEIYSGGKSEQMLGEFVRKENPDERQKNETGPIIATKFMPWPYLLPSGSLRKHLEASLRRLQVPKVDLYQLHSASLSLRSIETWMHAMADCADAGLVSHIGVSNVGLEAMKRADTTLRQRGHRLASNQIEFNLLRTSPESSGLLESCRDLEIVPLAYSPLALGALKERSLPLPARRRVLIAQSDDALESMRLALIAVATSKTGVTPAEVALSWVVAKNAVPLVGARTPEQVRSATKAASMKLSEPEINLLDTAAAACKVNLPWYHYRRLLQDG